MSDRYRQQRYRPPSGGFGGPGLTPIVQRLLIANVAVFLVQMFSPGNLIEVLGVSVHGVFQSLQLWQPFTYMWAHGSFMHVAFNMFALWIFGPQLELAWGSRKFLRFYLQCGIGAGFIILGWNTLLGSASVTLGASGAVELAFATLTLHRGQIPPTINYETRDPDCDLDYVPNEARECRVDVAISNSLGFGGHNTCLVVGRLDR